MSVFYSEPGIINAVDPLYYNGADFVGLTANDFSPGTAAQNTAVLRYLIGLATDSCAATPSFGTMILIPGHTIPLGRAYTGPLLDVGSTYYFQKPNPDTEPCIIPVDCNWPIRFLGTGNTVLSLIEDADGSGYSDFFQVTTSGPGAGDHTGGITFEDLYFSYPHIGSPGATPSTAIHVTQEGAENVRIVRCNFVDCLTSIKIENGLQASVLQCKFQYKTNVGTSIILGNNVPGSGGGVVKQIWIAGNLFYADHQNHKGSTGIIIYGAEHIKVADIRIDSYFKGIEIVPGPGHNAVRCTFTDVAIFCGTDDDGNVGTAVTIQPQADEDNPSVAQVSFTSCSFELGETADVTGSGGPGILVDATNGTVDNVRFVSCYSTRWPGPGLSVIGGASNIEVNGGFYSANQFDAGSGTQNFGIYLNEVFGVRIVGATCMGYYDWVTVSDTTVATGQDVGVYVDSEAENVLIEGCVN